MATVNLNTVEHWPVASLAEYHSDRTHESSSSLSEFLKDRWAYYLNRIRGEGVPRKYSPAMSLGTAFHVLLQQPERFDELVLLLPNGFGPTSKGGQNLMAANPHMAAIPEADLERVQGMVRACEANPAVMGLLSEPGDVEHAVRWRHELTGIGLKVCFDLLLADGSVIDFKSSANPTLRDEYGSFRRAIYDYGYYRQAALYRQARDLYRPFIGEGSGYYWVVVGNEPPHQAFVYRAGEATLELGRQHNEQILEALGVCRTFDSEAMWRGGNHGQVVDVDMDEWAFRKELQLS